MDIAIQQTDPRAWALDADTRTSALDYSRAVAAQEAARQSVTLLEALIVRDQDDPLTSALLPRLLDLAHVIVAAFDDEKSADELLRRVWGPKPVTTG